MLRIAGRRLSSLSWGSSATPSVAFAARNRVTAFDSSSDGPTSSMSYSFAFSNSILDRIRGFSSGALAPGQETGLVTDVPATVAAIKNPTSKIIYDEHNHEGYPPGDPSKRAFAYFVLTGGRFVYASLARLLILKFVLSMSASKDVLGLASLEVDLSSIEPGTTVTVKWRGKPVFIR